MPTIINRRGRPPHPDILTPAEWQVLEGVRAGHTNQEIADALGVTFHTVKYHVSNMLGKLHLQDRQDLAAWRPEPSPESRSRRWQALLPFGALKLTAGAAAVTATVGLGIAAFLAVRSLDPAPGSMLSADRLPQNSPGVAGAMHGVGHARAVVGMTVSLEEPLPSGVSLPAVSDVILFALTPEGERQLGVHSFEVAGGYDQPDAVVNVIVETEPLPAQTFAVKLTVGRTYFMTSRGDVPWAPPPPWVAYVLTADAPLFPDVTHRLASREIDTGYGWHYVIDGVDHLGSFLGVTYHAQGTVSGLQPEPAGAGALPFFALNPHTEFVEIPEGARSVTLRFGGARRPSPKGPPWEAGALESGDWTITVPLD